MQHLRQLLAVERRQKIDGSLIAYADRGRRVADHNRILAKVFHDDETVGEVGVKDGRRREAMVAQPGRNGDIGQDILGKMRDSAVGLPVAHRRTVGPARRVHQDRSLIVEQEPLESPRRGVALHAPAMRVGGCPG